MAVVNPNEMFFTAFEPKVANRFIMYVDGVPSYMIKEVGEITLEQGEIVLNHINTYRKVKGKAKWGDLNMTLYDPITPSGAQATMEWVRLHHESVTGRNGYSSMYKKNLTLNQLSPLGEKVEQWDLIGAFITDSNFGSLDWGSEDVMMVEMNLRYDYAIFQF